MAIAAAIMTFMLILLWFLLWTWYRSQRYMKKIVHPEQWRVLGITAVIFIIIIIASITIAVFI